jgi:hypothetical protein
MEFVTEKNSTRRARDFVKCEDPECPINKKWRRDVEKYGWPEDEKYPHCHPVF